MSLLRTAAVVVLAIAGLVQTASSCSKCKALTKDERVMIRSHSEACLLESKADSKLVADLFKGEIAEDPALKKHVLCILLKCKLMSKDGKLHKPAVLSKVSKVMDAGAAAKAVESCAKPIGDTPEDIAWNYFKCGLEKKNALFHSMGAEGVAAKKSVEAGKSSDTERGPSNPKIHIENLEHRSNVRPA